jgi:hypothetical protein
MDHGIANCKAKVVFSSEEAKNKDIKEYLGVRRESKSRSSKSESMLRKGERESSYNDDSLHSSLSILPPASKPKLTLKHIEERRNKNLQESLTSDNLSSNPT